jgi:hypothetical protein
MFSRIGSETYYASYDRKLEELQAYSAELRVCDASMPIVAHGNILEL